MSYHKLERIKNLYPTLAPLFDGMWNYILRQYKSGEMYFIPKLAAAYLKINDGEAFVLLDLLAQNDLLKRVYNVYCKKENTYLTTVDSPDALDEISHCDVCNVDHDPNDLKVEIAFALDKKSLKDIAA
jgi:hypothetical protein